MTRWALFSAVATLVLAVGCGRDGDPVGGDSIDSEHVTPSGPQLILTASPVYDAGDDNLCINVVALLRDSKGNPLANHDVVFEWSLGELEPATSKDDGTYRVTICSASNESGVVEASYQNGEDDSEKVSDSIELTFDEPIEPGVNTTPHVGAGPIAGTLRVYALARLLVGSPRPFEGAQVLIQKGDQNWVLHTGPGGYVELSEPGLEGPVDVTVGAQGYRFTTYLGVNAANIAVLMVPLDPVLPRDADLVGSIVGEVKGFLGEGGLPRWPAGTILGQLSDEESEVPVAIVQLAVRDVPLSSMSMGSVLESIQDPVMPIPTNMAICELTDDEDDSCEATFELSNIPAGQYLLFALGGTASYVLAAVENPYSLVFKPMALAISRVRVLPGTRVKQDLLLNIDLRPKQGTTVKIALDNQPIDWRTGKPLVNRLVMPVMDTGGEGFVFVSIDGSYHTREGRPVRVDPVEVRFPDDDHPVIKELGLKLNRLAVGLAGRSAFLGGDPAGISTPVKPGVQTGDFVDFSSSQAWLEVPRITFPAPVDNDVPLDTVSKDLFDGHVEWAPITNPRQPHLQVLRVNYLTAAPSNVLAGEGGTLGGPRSHCLWELFVPSDRTSVSLPVFPKEAAIKPVIANPEPTANNDPSPQRFDSRTIELELNAYILEAGGKPFDYNNNFAYQDVNLQCAVVSQDSTPAKTRQ